MFQGEPLLTPFPNITLSLFGCESSVNINSMHQSISLLGSGLMAYSRSLINMFDEGLCLVLSAQGKVPRVDSIPQAGSRLRIPLR